MAPSSRGSISLIAAVLHDVVEMSGGRSSAQRVSFKKKKKKKKKKTTDHSIQSFSCPRPSFAEQHVSVLDVIFAATRC